MKKYNLFTTKEIKPLGYIKNQLRIQAEGLSGNLDKMWRDIKDSKWIGGDAEGWERVPYWLDGFIPMAYLLEDEELISVAKKYMDAIISFQKPDGWICPCDAEKIPTYDTWAVLLISKVLSVYHGFSKEEKVLDCLYRVMKNFYSLLKDGTCKLFDWGKYRWYEGFIALNYLNKYYDEPWQGELALMLKEQGYDYTEAIEKWKRPVNRWTFETHIVNIGMMLKAEAVSCDLLGEEYKDLAKRLFDVLWQYNGTAVGTFTGDECLSGLSAVQGTELCAVVEQMYSYQQLISYTGDPFWAAQLEKVAFNALPATLSDDMWSHQYDQLSNQIACERFTAKCLFRTNSREAHLFGLEPNYGCCTANFSQGWSKLVYNAFMHKGDTVYCPISLPCVLDTEAQYISLETDYPFKNSSNFTVKAKKAFKLVIRIPDFAKNVKLDGEDFDGRNATVCFAEGEERVVAVSFDTIPEIVKRPHDLNSVVCGSLVFSVPVAYEKKMLEYEKNNVERKFPYCDYEYSPTTPWNYALCDTALSRLEKKVDPVPFSSQAPALTVKARVKRIHWDKLDGFDSVCAVSPSATSSDAPAEDMELYPYGCAKLRMTEIPLIG